MISNRGPGTTPKHQLRILERFYRVDSSRSSLSGETDPEPAIFNHIVLFHGGSVPLTIIRGG